MIHFVLDVFMCRKVVVLPRFKVQGLGFRCLGLRVTTHQRNENFSLHCAAEVSQSKGLLGLRLFVFGVRSRTTQKD